MQARKLVRIAALATSASAGFANVGGGKLPVYIYVDEWSFGANPVDQQLLKLSSAGATHLMLAFHVPVDRFEGHIADTVAEFANMSESKRKELINKLHEQGTEIYMSTGGETAGSIWFDSYSGEEYGKEVCEIAKKYGFDGVDFDLEHIPASFGSKSAYATWMEGAISACKALGFAGKITSAPQQAYMDPAWAGAKPWDYYPFDKHLIQYYNQGSYFRSEEVGTLFGSGTASVKTLMNRHPDAPKDAFVVGKPLIQGDASQSDPWISKTDLWKAGCDLWKSDGWEGGFMFWKGHMDDQSLALIEQMAKPCPGAVGPTPAPDDQPTLPTPPTEPATPATPPTLPTRPPTPRPDEPTLPSPPTPPPPTQPEEPTMPAPPTFPPPTMPTPPPRPDEPTRPASSSSSTTTTTTTTTPSSGGSGSYEPPCPGVVRNAAVEECERRIHATPGYAHFDSYCKGHCQVLPPGGCLQPQLCPGAQGSTADGLVNCLKTQLSYCTDL